MFHAFCGSLEGNKNRFGFWQGQSVFDTLTRRACGRLNAFRLDELCGIMWAYVRAKPESVLWLNRKALNADMQEHPRAIS